MSDERWAAVMARTDAAVGLLLQILIDKGVLTKSEIVLALDSATRNVRDSSINGQIVATVFGSLKEFVNCEPPHPVH